MGSGYIWRLPLALILIVSGLSYILLSVFAHDSWPQSLVLYLVVTAFILFHVFLQKYGKTEYNIPRWGFKRNVVFAAY